MIIEPYQIYHIYNQGNNKQKVFYSEENYLFFLKKIKKHILPFADILAWCLMPNHFHLMVYVHTLEVSGGTTSSRTPTTLPAINLNKSIGIMLASYTSAIHKQKKTSGSLFRDKTKAVCLTKAESITPSYFNSYFGTYLNLSIPEKEYPQRCFDYIHYNPVKANLVKRADDWEFSSCKDYSGLRNGKLINRERAKEFLSGIISGGAT